MRLINTCADCRRYILTELHEFEGVWLYLCYQCLRKRREGKNV
jgi:hypothetical protein